MKPSLNSQWIAPLIVSLSEILQQLDLTAIINLNAESSSDHLLLRQLEILLHDSSSSTESLR